MGGDKAADEAQAAIAEAKATKAKATKAEAFKAMTGILQAVQADREAAAEAKRAEAEGIALAKRAEALAEAERKREALANAPVITKPGPEETAPKSPPTYSEYLKDVEKAKANPNEEGFIALPFGLGFKYDKKAAGLENFRFARSKDEYWKNRPSWNKGPYSPEELAEYQAGCQA